MDKTEPAFPQGMPEHGSMPGLTKREYFAAMALQGMLAGGHNLLTIPEKIKTLKAIPLSAVDLADLLILELAK